MGRYFILTGKKSKNIVISVFNIHIRLLQRDVLSVILILCTLKLHIYAGN